MFKIRNNNTKMDVKIIEKVFAFRKTSLSLSSNFLLSPVRGIIRKSSKEKIPYFGTKKIKKRAKSPVISSKKNLFLTIVLF